MRRPAYSHINLAPLLDVIFVTLFVVLLGVSKQYKDQLDSEAQQHRQTVTGLEQSRHWLHLKLRRTQQRIKTHKNRQREAVAEKNTLLLELGRMQEELLDKEAALRALQRLLTEKEQEIATAKQVLERVKQGLEDQIAHLRGQLAKQQADADYLNRTIANLETRLDALLKEKQHLGRQFDALGEEKNRLEINQAKLRAKLNYMARDAERSKQRIADYREQLARVEKQWGDPVTATIKAEFVDKYIHTYTLELGYSTHKAAGRLSFSGPNRRHKTITFTSEKRVRGFLGKELARYNKDDVLVILLKEPDSRYLHERWVENYLREQNFMVGEGRRS